MDLAEKENKLKYTQREGQVLTLYTKTIPNISEKGHFSYSSPI
jgi:hypothetical protein